MKVLFISPYYFSSQSVIGGGERFVHELACALSKKAAVVLLTFDKISRSEHLGELRIEYLSRLASPDFLRWIRWADIVHCHQIRYKHTDAALMLGRIFHKKVFLTDLGGGQPRCLSDHFPLLNLADGFLMLSEFSKHIWVDAHPRFRNKTSVIGGGINPQLFFPSQTPRNRNIICVSRILPHKGIDVLIDALTDRMRLEVIGRVYDDDYYGYLKRKSQGKNVVFLHTLSDEALIQKYRESYAAVQPSVYQNYQGEKLQTPELFGLAAAEAMACGMPVIVSNTGSLQELVRVGETGYVVPASNPTALRERLEFLLDHPEIAAEVGRKAAAEARQKYAWDTVAQKCLENYQRGIQ